MNLSEYKQRLYLDKDKIRLYLDCDGVILDTINITYNMMLKNNININDEEEVKKFYENLDWDLLLKNPNIILNDSINEIKKLIDSNLFDIKVLTHFISSKEIRAKLNFFKETLPLEVIGVNKSQKKCDIVNAMGSILVDDYTPNLDSWYESGGISIKYSSNDKASNYLKIKNLQELIPLILTFEQVDSKKYKYKK